VSYFLEYLLLFVMLLHEIPSSQWLNKPHIQRGRGNGSHRGNYSGKWLKGQKARSWSNIPRWFEGWQTPLTQRLPKQRWFKKYFKLIADIVPLNLVDLQTSVLIEDGMTLTPEVCFELGLCGVRQSVKILGDGDLTKKLTIDWIPTSASAAHKIIAAGGSIQ